VYLRLERTEESERLRHLTALAFPTHFEVRPGYRNRGIGTRLITAAEHHLHGLGHHRVALAVEVNNTDAARLYKRLGYVDWGNNAVVCYSPLDDRRERHPEICNVLVKQLWT